MRSFLINGAKEMADHSTVRILFISAIPGAPILSASVLLLLDAYFLTFGLFTTR